MRGFPPEKPKLKLPITFIGLNVLFTISAFFWVAGKYLGFNDAPVLVGDNLLYPEALPVPPPPIIDALTFSLLFPIKSAPLNKGKRSGRL